MSLSDLVKARLAARDEEETLARVRRAAPGALLRKLQAPIEIISIPPTRRITDEIEKRLSLGLEETDPDNFAEIERICGLALMPTTLELEIEEEMNRKHVLAEHYERGGRLFGSQARALYHWERMGGLLGPIGAGDGKTLTLLRIAALAFRGGAQRILLFVPSQVVGQLLTRDLPFYRRRFPIDVPIMSFAGLSRGRRKILAQSSKRGCFVLPYSLLSSEDTVDILNWVQAEVLLPDEAHMLKHRSTPRTKRVMDYISKKRPQVAALSGTLTKTSILDYWHLALAALRHGTPLPLSHKLATEWAMVVDSKASPSEAQCGPIRPLVKWARKHFPGEDFSFDVVGFRKAFKLRLTSTPGVVSTGGDEVQCSLGMSNYPVKDYEKCEGWDKLKSLMDQVEDGRTPSGESIDHAIHTYKWLVEMSSGFYNELYWPEVGAFAKRKKIEESKAAQVVLAAREHHAALQDYSKALRKWYSEGDRVGLDTPMLVGNDMARNGSKHVPEDLYDLWLYPRKLKEEYEMQLGIALPERDKSAVRVCDFKVMAAVEWVLSLPRSEGALVWVYHKELGTWLTELLGQCDLPVLHCPAGKKYNILIGDEANKDRIVVASIEAHSTGKNLQFFHNQCAVEWPRGEDDAEQMIARTHRAGQETDHIDFVRFDTLKFDQMNFAACLNDSLYVQQTTGTRRRLMYANYDPMPVIFPDSVLRERGFQNKALNQEQRALMTEKFG